MSPMKQAFFILFCFVCFNNYFAQTLYYVDGINGNDGNNGTTTSTAWKTIQKACNSATPNSIVEIKGGTYSENIVVNITGTVGNPITIKNYLNDVVFIDGTGSNGTILLSITNKSYLRFQNLTIQNLITNDAQGILVETTGSSTSTGMSFKNITIQNISWTTNPSTIPTSNDNAQGFIAYGRDGGITNLTIDSCHVFNNILGFSEAISLDGNINGFVVQNCDVHHNTNIGIDLGGNYGVSSNAATDHARNGLISGNTCYNNVSLYATSGGIYVDGGKNIIIEKNRCYENGNGIEIGCEENGTVDSIIVKNNLIYNNQQAGISVGGYTTATTGQVLNSVIRNNTFLKNNYSADGTGELVISKASNCVFENNIFYTTNQNILLNVDDISPQANNIINYNCWYTATGDSNDITVNWRATSYNTFSDYKNGTLQEMNSIFLNPSLTDLSLPNPDLHLSANSPCINTGLPSTVIASNETDYGGNVRINNTVIDIGAYEFTNFSTGTSFKERNELNIFVFPNPFISTTTIEFPKVLLDGKLTIYDAFGRSKNVMNNINGRKIIVTKEDLSSGIYFFELIEKNNFIAKGKFVVE
jgi:parallel beta-helix repeat protein